MGASARRASAQRAQATGIEAEIERSEIAAKSPAAKRVAQTPAEELAHRLIGGTGSCKQICTGPDQDQKTPARFFSCSRRNSTKPKAVPGGQQKQKQEYRSEDRLDDSHCRHQTPPIVFLQQAKAVFKVSPAGCQEEERMRIRKTGELTFFRYTDYTAVMYDKVNRIVFWKLAYWLARKYKTSIKSLMRQWIRRPADGTAMTWVLFGRSGKGNLCGITLERLASSRNAQFRWRNPSINPYLRPDDGRSTVTSRYRDVAMAMGHA